MKIRDFIRQPVDIDVYDDVCEELGIAFCGPLYLTDAGQKKFAEVLDYEIEPDNGCMIVHVDDEKSSVWKHKLKVAKQFFYAAAGYCDADDYDKWFAEEEGSNA